MELFDKRNGNLLLVISDNVDQDCEIKLLVEDHLNYLDIENILKLRDHLNKIINENNFIEN